MESLIICTNIYSDRSTRAVHRTENLRWQRWWGKDTVQKKIIQEKFTLLATDCAAVTGEDETVVLARGLKLKFGKDDVLMGNDISGSIGISIS